jgi:hypothetical protein
LVIFRPKVFGYLLNCVDSDAVKVVALNDVSYPALEI